MPDEHGNPTEEEKVTAAATVQAQPLTREQIDEMLAERDQRLLGTVQQTLTQTLVQLLPQQQQQQQMQEHQQQTGDITPQQVAQELSISAEDFWRNPQAAMQKFYEVKVAPLAKQMQQRPQQQADNTGILALAETQKIQLLGRMSSEERTRYEPYLNEVFKKTDPRILATPEGLDSVYRLTKSYADDHMRQVEETRTKRNQNANLQQSNSGSTTTSTPVQLSDTEKSVAEAMGISPELYKKYSVAEEVEIGGNRKK